MGRGVIKLDGVVKDPKSIIDYQLSCYFYSHSKQNARNPEVVYSLPTRMFEHQGTPSDLAAIIESDVQRILGNHFDAVDVRTTVDSLEKGYNINLDVNVISGGVTYPLVTLIRSDGRLLKDIFRITNGEPTQWSPTY